MTFEPIQLTSEQVEELYSSNLVLTAVPNQLTTETTIPTVTTGITGKNKKQFVWVVNEPGYPFLSDADFQFLSEVVNACKMNMDDIALVNIAKNKMAYTEVIDQLQPKFLIVSFLNKNWITENTDAYTLQQQQGYQLYITEPPDIIRNDKVKKSKLWLALKQMLAL